MWWRTHHYAGAAAEISLHRTGGPGTTPARHTFANALGRSFVYTFANAVGHAFAHA